MNPSKNRKDKALVEATALLISQKRSRHCWGRRIQSNHPTVPTTRRNVATAENPVRCSETDTQFEVRHRLPA